MNLIPTHIPDVVIIQPTVFEDERGWFIESFNETHFHRALQDLGLPLPKHFVQDNHSASKKNILRGLHYQKAPHAQGKLVRVVKGAAYDVAVDIREDSPTCGQHVGIELNEDNKTILWIPEGFAHGFLALTEDTHFLYKTTDFYHKTSEQSILWNDPLLAIDWPLSQPPILNDKDQSAPLFSDTPLFSRES